MNYQWLKGDLDILRGIKIAQRRINMSIDIIIETVPNIWYIKTAFTVYSLTAAWLTVG